MINKKRDYKGIKVPEEVYEDLNELKEIIIRNGLSSISNDFINYVPKSCPKCNTEMDSVEVNLGYHHCPNCEFKYPEIKLGLGGSLAIGTLIGLGIAGIIYLLTRKDE